MTTKEQKKQYLEEKVNPIIQRLIVDILAETPEDVIGFIRNWLDVKSGVPSPTKIPESETREDDDLSGSDEEDDEDHTEELPTKEEIIAKNQARSTRASVSAEVYGKFNQKSAFEPKLVQKKRRTKRKNQNQTLSSFHVLCLR